MCERWVGDGTDCNILTPSSSGHSSTSSSFCWAAQLGSWGPKPCLELVLTVSNCNSNWLQLTEAVCGTRLYNFLTSTCFLWASHLHRIQPVHRSVISSTGCTCFLIDGSVEGQYVTKTVCKINFLKNSLCVGTGKFRTIKLQQMQFPNL